MGAGSRFLGRWRRSFASISTPGLSSATWGRGLVAGCCEQVHRDREALLDEVWRGGYVQTLAGEKAYLVGMSVLDRQPVQLVAKRVDDAIEIPIYWRSSVPHRLRRTVKDEGDQNSWIWKCWYSSLRGWWWRRGRLNLHSISATRCAAMRWIRRDGQSHVNRAATTAGPTRWSATAAPSRRYILRLPGGRMLQLSSASHRGGTHRTRATRCVGLLHRMRQDATNVPWRLYTQ